MADTKTYHLMESEDMPTYEIECADDYGANMQEMLAETAVFTGTHEECVAAWLRYTQRIENADVEEMVA